MRLPSTAATTSNLPPASASSQQNIAPGRSMTDDPQAKVSAEDEECETAEHQTCPSRRVDAAGPLGPNDSRRTP